MNERASEQSADGIADLLLYPPPQVKVQENISREIYLVRPPGRNGQFPLQNPSGAVCQVPSPEDGARRTDLSQFSTPSTTQIRTLAVSGVIVKVVNSEGGSQSVIAPTTSTSSTTSTQSRLKIQTNVVAVTSVAPTTEDAEVNNSNVRTGQENLKVVTTTPAAENATPDSSNVGSGGCPPVGITAPTIEDLAAQNLTPTIEDVAAQNTNVGTQTLATENATLDSSNVVVEKSIVEKGAPDNPNVETGVPASEEVVPNNPNMRRVTGRPVKT
ncbi:mucin-5AC-like isoform X3 [Coffea eugenioides]|uniref:mucin-5AC-like isoform X3 n=1 Tax=Coffea eugenioides TaxID=49369 RepID=UPI000F60BE6C|nr:mucin-5AC-like isoform X3 [Coffea eugenioides]